MTSLAPRSLALLFLAACAGQEAKQPNPMRSIDERRAIPIIAQAYQDSGQNPAEGRDIRLTTGKVLHVDVATAGHKYGVAYLTTGDLAGLDPKARAEGGDAIVGLGRPAFCHRVRGGFVTRPDRTHGGRRARRVGRRGARSVRWLERNRRRRNGRSASDERRRRRATRSRTRRD